MSNLDRTRIPSNYYLTIPVKVTPREREILMLLAEDRTSKELAQQLHISLETVKSHRSSLIRKLGVKTTGG